LITSNGEPNIKKTPAVMIMQHSLTSLRIKEIRARSCEVLSVNAMPKGIKSYQGCHLRQVVQVVGELFENIGTTRLELICGIEEAVSDQTERDADIGKHVNKQHRGPEVFDALL
jgi:hypothetical protein